MAKHLLLIRHGKAANEPAGFDVDRPLAERGHRDMAALGAWLETRGQRCNRVSVSAAKRTRESWQVLSESWQPGGKADEHESLYLATAGDLLNFVQQQEDAHSSLAIIGHNPGLHQLGLLLAAPNESVAYEELELGFPTTACLGLSLNIEHWSDAAPALADVDLYWTPRLGALT